MKRFIDSQNFLRTIRDEASKNNDAAQELVAGLRADQLNWAVAPGSWSMAQCLDHLAVTTKGFDPYFISAIDRGRQKWPNTAPVAYQPTFMGGWLIKYIVPESTRRVPAPKVFQPSQSPLIEDALEKYLTQQKQFLNFVQSTDGIDYNRTRLRSPVTPLMRYSLADAFVITVVHSWRHLAQAKRVRETQGFPD